MTLIARRHPVAVDLRQAVAILRIASELERIGDLAKNIGKRVGALERADLPRQFMGGVLHIATLILAQLGNVLDSLANRDVAKAIEVWSRDQDVDRLYTSLFRELLTHMVEDPGTVTSAVHLVFCTKNIESFARRISSGSAIMRPISRKPSFTWSRVMCSGESGRRRILHRCSPAAPQRRQP